MVYVSHVQKRTFSGVNLFIDIFRYKATSMVCSKIHPKILSIYFLGDGVKSTMPTSLHESISVWNIAQNFSNARMIILLYNLSQRIYSGIYNEGKKKYCFLYSKHMMLKHIATCYLKMLQT